MEPRSLVWSATTCDFPGAGVYLGLAPQSEHAALCRVLTARQLRCYAGGTCRMRADGPSWALNYFAVRDPSAVKVKPLDRPALPNGFRHVKLVFQFERAGMGGAAGGSGGAGGGERAAGEGDNLPFAGEEQSSPAFLLTIGLRPTKEEEFFQKVIGDYPDQAWGEVYRRLADMGCRDVSEYT